MDQAEEIVAGRLVIYDGFKAAVATRRCAIAPGSSSMKLADGR